MRVLHIPVVHGHDISKHIPLEKSFPLGWKCYETIGSYVSCVFIEHEHLGSLESTQELLSATPRATFTHLSYSPNSHMLHISMNMTYEPIVAKKEKNLFQFKLSIGNLIHSLFCFLLMEGWLFNVWHHLKQFFFFIRLIVFLFCFFSSGDLFSQNRFAGIIGGLLCLYHLTPKCD